VSPLVPPPKPPIADVFAESEEPPLQPGPPAPPPPPATITL